MPRKKKIEKVDFEDTLQKEFSEREAKYYEYRKNVIKQREEKLRTVVESEPEIEMLLGVSSTEKAEEVEGEEGEVKEMENEDIPDSA